MKICIAVLLAIGSACGGPAEPRVKFYDLSGSQQPVARYAPSGPIVALESMNAAPGLDSDQVAIRSADGNIQHYLYHRWQAPVPRLVDQLIAEVFTGSGHFRRVEIENASGDADLIVTGRILRLEGIRRRADTTIVRVSILFSARSPISGAEIWSRLYSRDLPVTQHSVDALAAALRNAISSISSQAATEVAMSACEWALHLNEAGQDQSAAKNLRDPGKKSPECIFRALSRAPAR